MVAALRGGASCRAPEACQVERGIVCLCIKRPLLRGYIALFSPVMSQNEKRMRVAFRPGNYPLT